MCEKLWAALLHSYFSPLSGYFWLLISCWVVSNSLRPCGLEPTRLLCLWDFLKQEYWSGLLCPPPGDLPDLGVEPVSPAWQVDSLPLSHPGSPYFWSQEGKTQLRLARQEWTGLFSERWCNVVGSISLRKLGIFLSYLASQSFPRGHGMIGWHQGYTFSCLCLAET